MKGGGFTAVIGNRSRHNHARNAISLDVSGLRPNTWQPVEEGIGPRKVETRLAGLTRGFLRPQQIVAVPVRDVEHGKVSGSSLCAIPKNSLQQALSVLP